MIDPVDEQARAKAAEQQLQLTKPAGALGRLEDLGNQLSAISGRVPPPSPMPALVAVFAGDHGIHAQGVTPWPQEITRSMAATIAKGRAGVSAIARTVGADVWITDVGMMAPVDHPAIRQRAIARGTQDFSVDPAMTREQVDAAIEVGRHTAAQAVAAGYRCLATGEVGLANTTPAAALISVFTDRSPEEVTGRGAGSDDAMLAHKAQVIADAIALHGATADDPMGALAAVGGFEHAALVGLILGGAEQRVPVILDGVIACSAALVACRLDPDVTGYLVAGHAGVEPGITAALETLGLEPLVELGLRLGEGTGAALALPLLAAAAAIPNEMATFADLAQES
jgi:nicotinate-nucleotide--dimethylbenzimidazole phosphoribosyltransferase